jgi:hypothetical protein
MLGVAGEAEYFLSGRCLSVHAAGQGSVGGWVGVHAPSLRAPCTFSFSLYSKGSLLLCTPWYSKGGFLASLHTQGYSKGSLHFFLLCTPWYSKGSLHSLLLCTQEREQGNFKGFLHSLLLCTPTATLRALSSTPPRWATLRALSSTPHG